MSKIQVINMNDGNKIGYEISKNKIIFDDELMLNLEKYERDEAMHIDICKDEFGCLCMGLASNYVAQIEIPARIYEYLDKGTDEFGNSEIQKVPVPFDMCKVTITLWGIE